MTDKRTAVCVCGEINMRHCPVHGQGDVAAMSDAPEVHRAMGSMGSGPKGVAARTGSGAELTEGSAEPMPSRAPAPDSSAASKRRDMDDWLEGQPHRYRKKPVVIEAARLLDHNGAGIAEWSGGVLRGGPSGGSKGGHVIIHTLEGDHLAMPGDYVVRGIQGEFYPVKPDIFEATYEAVDA